VWFRHPLLVPSWRRRNQARPGLISLNPPATVTTRIRSPGRARYKLLKPLRGECRVESGVTVVTTLVCFILFRTRGCGCIGHPAFPAPSFPGRTIFAKLGRLAPRDRGVVFEIEATSLLWSDLSAVAPRAKAEATKQSSFLCRGEMDCFAPLAMTLRGRSASSLTLRGRVKSAN
jgi:hypothetical protein